MSADDFTRDSQNEFEERTVFVNRCAKVVKGGRRFSFAVTTVVGDRNGRVGLGFGKANELSEAMRKANDYARRHLVSVTMKGKTLPHEVLGQCDGGRVLLKPASEGTGLIAGGAMRAVLEVAGVRDVLGKSQGSKNRLNVAKATLDALAQLRTAEDIKALRSQD